LNLNQLYTRKSREYILTHPVCEARICCRGAASIEVHHKSGRTGINLVRHFLAVCRGCHDWIGKYVTDAIRLGFSFKRNLQIPLERVFVFTLKSTFSYQDNKIGHQADMIDVISLTYDLALLDACNEFKRKHSKFTHVYFEVIKYEIL
jgi:hypothetical protein